LNILKRKEGHWSTFKVSDCTLKVSEFMPHKGQWGKCGDGRLKNINNKV
jgi:hypothetical protein